MSTTQILQKNAYLVVLIKDNHMFANLAYTDFSSQKTYLLSDITDLSALKFRMDDVVFSKNFWFEYFDALEKEFGWNIVDRRWGEVFKIVDFEDEGEGVSGIKILVDDDQPFFNNIFTSLKEFSKDIVLRVADERYIQVLMEELRVRLGYDDLLWVDMDLAHFSVFRTYERESPLGIFSKDAKKERGFFKSKISWSSEIGLIDSIKNSKLRAFLSSEYNFEDLVDKWANFVANTPDLIVDPVLDDLLRSFATIQNLSMKEENREKFDAFGRGKSAVILTGKLAKLLRKRDLFLSLIDGFELEGIFDLYLDVENRILSYGKDLVEGSEAENIMVIKGDILPGAYKVVIPEVNVSKGKNRVLFSAKISSQDFEERDIYALNPSLEIFTIPNVVNKVVVEGALKNGAVLTHFSTTDVSFVSTRGGVRYDGLVVDCRIRPIIYGPSAKENKIKLQSWGDGN
ncbi:MAG: hypothetical protein ACOX0X_02495 [Candidatus Dojkabacteria bacterium]